MLLVSIYLNRQFTVLKRNRSVADRADSRDINARARQAFLECLCIRKQTSKHLKYPSELAALQPSSRDPKRLNSRKLERSNYLYSADHIFSTPIASRDTYNDYYELVSSKTSLLLCKGGTDVRSAQIPSIVQSPAQPLSILPHLGTVNHKNSGVIYQ